MKPEFMRLRRALTLALATLLATAGITLLSPAGAALAHHNTVRVSAACVDHTWTITWTITNSEAYKSETIVESNQPFVPVDTRIGPGETLTVTETVDGPVSRTLTVVGHWEKGDVTDSPRSAHISPYDFAGPCEPPAPPATPVITLTADACEVSDTSTADLTATVTGLPAGAAYTVRLFSGANVVDTAQGTATTGSATASFPGVAPGDYRAEVQATGSYTITSATVTAVECSPAAPPLEPEEPLPPVSTPRLVITPLDCSTDVTTPTVSVSVTGLDATQEYEVVLLDEDGQPVASQPLTGVASDDVTFDSLDAPASYAAVLLVEPGQTVVTETVDLANVVPCLSNAAPLPTLPLEEGGAAPAQQLPTLAATGPGEFAALAAFAALLLGAGGTVVTARLRRRAVAAA